jgi:predicted PurR-regulated permease PerM
MVATGATVLAFTFVLAFTLFVGWAVLRFLSFASPALTPVIAGLFLALLFKPYYGWFLAARDFSQRAERIYRENREP